MRVATYPPGTLRVILPGGIVRRLYVDRVRAVAMHPPIIVEDTAAGVRHYGSAVNWVLPPMWEPCDPTWDTSFKWSGNHTDVPALWVETDSALEVIL